MTAAPVNRGQQPHLSRWPEELQALERRLKQLEIALMQAKLREDDFTAITRLSRLIKEATQQLEERRRATMKAEWKPVI